MPPCWMVITMRIIHAGLLLIVSAIASELLFAMALTIIAHRTNTVGLGWIVVLLWMFLAGFLAYLSRKRLPTAIIAGALALSFILSLAAFEYVCLPWLRVSGVLMK